MLPSSAVPSIYSSPPAQQRSACFAQMRPRQTSRVLASWGLTLRRNARASTLSADSRSLQLVPCPGQSPVYRTSCAKCHFGGSFRHMSALTLLALPATCQRLCCCCSSAGESALPSKSRYATVQRGLATATCLGTCQAAAKDWPEVAGRYYYA